MSDVEEGDEVEDVGEWVGIEDVVEVVCDEDEYVDEDKYIIVMVEFMGGEEFDDEESKVKVVVVVKEKENVELNFKSVFKKCLWSKNKMDDGKGKLKKKKFWYEIKVEW